MPAPDEYLTIARPGRAELRAKGSRFFGFAQPVGNKEEANRQRSELKRKYHDATHQPFAYRLAEGQERSSDDGEPRGTSGPSILAEIRSADLFNVQVVVVRYFGGTKLGKGGLARAFSECANTALESAANKKAKNTSFLNLTIGPEEVNLVKGIASKFDAKVASLSYDMKAHLLFTVPASRLDECRQALQNRFGPDIFEQSA